MLGAPPIALALVVCDAIWRDPGTGKMTLLGTFTEVNAKSLPVTLPIMSAYLVLTNGRGKTKIKVQVVDGDETREPITSAEVEISFDHPRQSVELPAAFAGVEFPALGEYRVQVFADSEFLIERSVFVLPVREG